MKSNTIHTQKQQAGFYKNPPSRIRAIPKSDGTFLIVLSLKAGDRKLGTLDKRARTLTTSRERDHVLRNIPGGALALNLELLNMSDFDIIKIKLDTEILKTTRSYYLARGKIERYGSAGFETQVVLPLPEFGIEKAERWERARNNQIELKLNGDD